MITIDQLCKLLQSSRAVQEALQDARSCQCDTCQRLVPAGKALRELGMALPLLDRSSPPAVAAEMLERCAILILCSAHAYRCAAVTAAAEKGGA